MDPNGNLGEQRRIIERMNETFDRDEPPDSQDAYRLAELVEALDGWLSRGGFLPNPWKREA